jgi:hypothetical protein
MAEKPTSKRKTVKRDSKKPLANKNPENGSSLVEKIFPSLVIVTISAIFYASLGVAVIPPTYGGITRQNAFFAPTHGKITAIPREPILFHRMGLYFPLVQLLWN